MIFRYCANPVNAIPLHSKTNINFHRMNKLTIGMLGGLLMTGSVSPAFAADPPASNATPKNQTTQYDDFSQWRIGGYGEMLARFKDYGQNRYTGTSNGTLKKDHNEISIPRFVLQGEYKFSSKWILGAEIEFEAGGTGSAYEIEEGSGSENGEYETETEKGGEVALEQFHITRLITPAFNVRVGHMVLPVGLSNTHHEPLFFFSASRPESETEIIPSTWHETGLEFFGDFGKGLASFSYQAMITAGLNPDGFGKYNWVKNGKQGAFEFDNFTAPAYTLRLNWTGVPGLRLGFSTFLNPNAGKNCEKLTSYDNEDDINIYLYSFDAQYVNRYVTARANVIHGYLSNSDGINSHSVSSSSPYGTRKRGVGSHALGYNAELGINIASFFRNPKFPVIYPFAQYAYYNPQESVASTTTRDPRAQVSMWTFGLNWKPLPSLVVKADYATRQIGTHAVFAKGQYNSENEFRVAVAYTLYYGKK